ncbi:hypothetical protein L6164_008187 [Bauhinia variegata]|uniref:Uncharacterized protein n=1 Tax=Bauhinia variegata TaxID=167791 RepID=A0ACB9PIT2_BAUVA|nr:hypothetical protein L6164_008187 [Bauhinia variegata]
MKTAFIALVPLFASFCSVAPLPVAGDAAPEPVLDNSGKQLQAGAAYHILPVLKCGGRFTKCRDGGGLALASIRNRSCPLDVVEASHGLPLAFPPVNARKGIVRVSTDLNIKFNAASSASCVQSTVWKLDQFDSSSGQWFVTTGGVEGNPGRQTVSNWFEIERYGDDYKLVFCPKVCKFCKVLCKDLGIYVDEKGNRVLALSDVPYRVRFQRA